MAWRTRAWVRGLPRRIGGRKKLALAVVLTAVVALAAAGWTFTRPQRLSALIAGAVARATGAEVTLASAQFIGPWQIELTGLSIRVPDVPDEPGAVFHAEQVLVHPRLGSLLTGAPEAEAVTLLRPTLWLTEDAETGRYTFAALTGPRDPEVPPPTWPERLPRVLVRLGEVVFGRIEAGGYRELARVPLEGRLTADPDRASSFGFVLERPADPDITGPAPRLTGSVELTDRTLDARLTHFGFDPRQKTLLPMPLRQWWAGLEPRGRIPVLALSVELHPDGRVSPRFAEVELEDVSLSLPFDAYQPRMTGVSGRLRLEEDAARLEHLIGQIEGVRYDIDGSLDGLAPDAPLRLTIRTEPFNIPENPRFLIALPPALRKTYDNLAPRGLFRIDAEITRSGPGEPLSYDGTVQVLDAEMAYHRFPYPTQGLRGELRFSRDAVTFERITGRGPSGAVLEASGSIAPPGDAAEVHIDITAKGVPLDEHLIAAMEPQHREVMDLFFARDRLAELVAAGVLRDTAATGSASGAPGGSPPPVFELGGDLNLRVSVYRPPGDDQRYAVTTRLDTTGLASLFEPWPYPLQSTGGEVVISPDRIEVHDVVVAGPTGARAVIHGHLLRPGGGQRPVPELTISDGRLPIDPLLLASIPPPQDQWVRAAGLKGVLQTAGRVYENETGRIDFDIATTLSDGVARPFNGRFELSTLEGSARLTRSSIRIEGVTGEHGDTVLSLSGDANWSGGTVAYRFNVSADDLTWSPAVADLIPPGEPGRAELLALAEAYNPEARFDASLRLVRERAGSTEAEPPYHLTIEPSLLGLDLRGQRVRFTEMTGRAELEPGLLHLRELAGDFDGGQAGVSGLVTLDEQPAAAVSLTGRADGLSPPVRAMAPTGVLGALDALSFDGPFEIEAGRLVTRPEATDQPAVTFEAAVRLLGASASIGVPITALQGRLEVDLALTPGASFPRLDLALEADRLRAADRLIAPLSVTLRSLPDDPRSIRLESMQGRVYGGRLVGRGLVRGGSDGGYRFDLTLSDVAFEPMTDPTGSASGDAASASDPSEATTGEQPPGRLSAGLTIAAPFDDPSRRRGRGALEVRGASIYRQPLALAMLQALSFNLPTIQAFDRVSARYLVTGDTVRFDTLRFDAPRFAILGSGTMDYPTRQLDLQMVTRNPAGLDLGPITDVFQVLRDQLVALQITGDLESPRVRVVSFETVRKTWEELFGQRGRFNPAIGPAR